MVLTVLQSSYDRLLLEMDCERTPKSSSCVYSSSDEYMSDDSNSIKIKIIIITTITITHLLEQYKQALGVLL